MRHLALLALATVLAGCGTTPARLAAPTPSATTGGPLFGASGRVVAIPGGPVRFCAPTVSTLMGPDPVATPCPLGVDVEGVDLDRLDRLRAEGGAVEGYAALTGSWDGALLRVRTQGVADRDDGLSGLFTDPPCPAPAQGWPRGTMSENLDSAALADYQAKHPGEVVQIAFARPSSTQVVAFLLTTGDVARTERDLRPAYSSRLCVVRSRFTAAQREAARQDLMAHFQEYGLTSGAGEDLGEDGQARTGGDAVVLTPALEALVARHPAGLVEIRPWLKLVDSAP